MGLVSDRLWAHQSMGSQISCGASGRGAQCLEPFEYVNTSTNETKGKDPKWTRQVDCGSLRDTRSCMGGTNHRPNPMLSEDPKQKRVGYELASANPKFVCTSTVNSDIPVTAVPSVHELAAESDVRSPGRTNRSSRCPTSHRSEAPSEGHSAAPGRRRRSKKVSQCLISNELLRECDEKYERFAATKMVPKGHSQQAPTVTNRRREDQ